MGKINIAFLLEHKSKPEKFPHIQALRYMIETWDIEIGNKKKKLTPIIPILIYHGKDTWNMRPFERYFGKTDSDLMQYLPIFMFHMTNLVDYPKEIILHLEAGLLINTFMMLKHYRDKDFLKNNAEYIFNNKPDFWDDETKRNFLNILFAYFIKMSEISTRDFHTYIAPKLREPINKEVMSTWDNLVAESTQKGVKQGIEQGIEQLNEKNVTRLNKKGKSIVEIADLLDLPIEKVKFYLKKNQK
jgi:predicted transposase/invertase (TIGR01784 family)